MNNATCVGFLGYYECKCPTNYYGSKCECSKSESSLESNKGSTGNISSCIKYLTLTIFE